MRVLVTGATGFAGHHIVPALLEAGHDVRALARGTHPSHLPESVDFVAGSVADPESLARAAKGVDACVHLVAVIVERGSQTFERVNHAGTRNLVEALARAGVGRVIHQSALGAGPDERFPYLRTKWLGEEAVRASGLGYTILRPSALFGDGAGFFKPIVWTLRWMPLYPLPRGGTTRFQPLWADDLARCVVRCLDGTAIGETLDLGGPDVLDFKEIVEIVMRALGKRRRTVSIPLWMARPFAYLQQLRRDPLVTNQQLDMIVLDNHARPDSVKGTFGFDPVRIEDTDLRWLAAL